MPAKSLSIEALGYTLLDLAHNLQIPESNSGGLMKGTDLLETARGNKEKLNDVYSTVEALILRRYVNGRPLNHRIDDLNTEDVNLKNYTHVVVVLEVLLPDLVFTLWPPHKNADHSMARKEVLHG